MINEEWNSYLTTFFAVAGILVGLLFWCKNLLVDVKTQITGIWSNADQTLRILIYDMDSNFKGDIIWSNEANNQLLGKSILQNFNLRFFLFGKGYYQDPYSNRVYSFRLRKLSKESLQLYLVDERGVLIANETWNLMQAA